ncbi:MAG: pyridoxal phosphate-dependent aminotransferase [Pseudomonadota bacterium]
MKFSSLADRIGGEGVDAWEVHYDALARVDAGDEVIVLSVGQELEKLTPDPIVDSAVASLRAGRHHYTPVNGNENLRQAIVERHLRNTGQSVSADQCVVFAGAQNALFSVAQVLLESGDEVILSEPYYTTYPATFSATGAHLVSVPTRAEHGFQIDPDAILAAVTPRTRAIVINSPNNPVGAVYERQRLDTLVRECARRDIWLISDEVYQELLPENERCSAASAPGADKVVVTVSSVSKSHRMTGWRIGWVVGPEILVTPLYNLCMCMAYGLPQFTMDAAVTALRDDFETALDVGESMNRRRDIMLTHLESAPGLSVHAAVGGMFVVLDVRDLGVSSQQFARQLLDRYDVAVLPCDGFGSTGSGLIRVSLCTTDEQIVVASVRIVEYVKSLRASD